MTVLRGTSFLGAALSLLLGAATLCAASPITYTVNQTIGAGSVTGFVETDGTIGILGASNILDWNLVVNDPSNPPTVNLLGPLSGANSQLGVVGSDLSATASQLLFNFSGLDGGYVLFQHPSLFTGHDLWCAQSAGFLCSVSLIAGETLATSGGNLFSSSSLSGTLVIASTPVPEPSTWLLLGTSLAAVAARRRFTKRT